MGTPEKIIRLIQGLLGFAITLGFSVMLMSLFKEFIMEVPELWEGILGACIGCYWGFFIFAVFANTDKT